MADDFNDRYARIMSAWADKQKAATDEYQQNLEQQQMAAGDNWATMAVQGAGLGAAFGPYGALAGGGLGALLGLYGGYKNREALGDKNAFGSTLSGGIDKLGGPQGMQAVAGAMPGFVQMGKSMGQTTLTPEQRHLENITEEATRGTSLKTRNADALGGVPAMYTPRESPRSYGNLFGVGTGLG